MPSRMSMTLANEIDTLAAEWQACAKVYKPAGHRVAPDSHDSQAVTHRLPYLF